MFASTTSPGLPLWRMSGPPDFRYGYIHNFKIRRASSCFVTTPDLSRVIKRSCFHLQILLFFAPPFFLSPGLPPIVVSSSFYARLICASNSLAAQVQPLPSRCRWLDPALHCPLSAPNQPKVVKETGTTPPFTIFSGSFHLDTYDPIISGRKEHFGFFPLHPIDRPWDLHLLATEFRPPIPTTARERPISTSDGSR